MYGKFAGFGDFIFHYDAYIVGGVGVIRTKPIPVIDPDNRTFNWNTLVNFDVGIGLRIFFNRWLAAVLEVRDIMYFEKIENITVAKGAASPAGCGYDESPLNPAHLVRPEHPLHQRRPVASRALAVPADFLRLRVAEMRTETRTAMKRRFVRTVLASLAVGGGAVGVRGRPRLKSCSSRVPSRALRLCATSGCIGRGASRSLRRRRSRCSTSIGERSSWARG